jgi:hypothetical protein
MKSEEIAVLRILYKHNGPFKLSALVEGFPDQSKSLIVDAVSNLQLLSYLSMTECSSVLYVAINRQMRRIVLNLLQNDSERYNPNKILENEIQLSHPIRVGHSNLHNELSYKPDLKKIENRDLWLRLPKRALKLSISVLVFSFVILGTITALNLQSTTSSSTYAGTDEATPFMIASSSSLVTEMQKGRTIPVDHVYNSGLNEEAHTSEPSIYEGFFTKVVSEPASSHDDAPVYYHYMISEKQGLLLLEQISLVAPLTSGSNNSSLSAILDNHGKEFSST